MSRVLYQRLRIVGSTTAETDLRTVRPDPTFLSAPLSISPSGLATFTPTIHIRSRRAPLLHHNASYKIPLICRLAGNRCNITSAARGPQIRHRLPPVCPTSSPLAIQECKAPPCILTMPSHAVVPWDACCSGFSIDPPIRFALLPFCLFSRASTSLSSPRPAQFQQPTGS